MTVRHLTQHELARRWALSPRTLERWRWTGEGPRFLKLNGKIAYREADVQAFEDDRVKDKTAGERRS
jgi:predicted site-specific integrase-resolvase